MRVLLLLCLVSLSFSADFTATVGKWTVKGESKNGGVMFRAEMVTKETQKPNFPELTVIVKASDPSWSVASLRLSNGLAAQTGEADAQRFLELVEAFYKR